MALACERDGDAPAYRVHAEPVTQVVRHHHRLDVVDVLHRRRAEEALELRDLRAREPLRLDGDVFPAADGAVGTGRVLRDVLLRERLAADPLGGLRRRLLRLVVSSTELPHVVYRVDETARAVLAEHLRLLHERSHPARRELSETLLASHLRLEGAFADRDGLDAFRPEDGAASAAAGDALAVAALVYQTGVSNPVLAGRPGGEDVDVVIRVLLAPANRLARLVGLAPGEVGRRNDRRAVLVDEDV